MHGFYLGKRHSGGACHFGGWNKQRNTVRQPQDALINIPVPTSKPPETTADACLAAVGNPTRAPQRWELSQLISSPQLVSPLLFHTHLQLQLLKAPACRGGVGWGWGGGPKQGKVPRGPHCSKGGLKHVERRSAILPISHSGREYPSEAMGSYT